jgi:cytochrome bd ubiquinol oxidase subunit I
MHDLLFARWQMAVSLGFHILFAVAGMAMPLFMVLAEWRYLKKGEVLYRELAVRWAKGTAILFAVGAVSGTVLSFELGLLWPKFMERAGPLVGMPFSLEGFAFFLEAIALGIYLYGWDRVPPRAHLASGVVVAVSGLMSGVFVVAVNAWMNTPRGFRVDGAGQWVDLDLSEAFFTPAFPTQALHMAAAAYSSVAFAVLGIHAARLRRDPNNAFHRAALKIVIPIVIASMPIQLISGDLAGKQLAREQPLKLAAIEALFETQRGAPLLLGGVPNMKEERVEYGIELPKLLSFAATGDADGVVRGLRDFPRENWPPVPVVHYAFQIMVGAGSAMTLVAAWAAWLLVRRRSPADSPWFLRVAVCCAPLGLIALEAGWTVTEVGRQPFIVQGVMRVRDALTPMPGLWVPFTLSVLLYLVLGAVVTLLLFRHVLSAPRGDAAELAAGGVADRPSPREKPE